MVGTVLTPFVLVDDVSDGLIRMIESPEALGESFNLIVRSMLTGTTTSRRSSSGSRAAEGLLVSLPALWQRIRLCPAEETHVLSASDARRIILLDWKSRAIFRRSATASPDACSDWRPEMSAHAFLRRAIDHMQAHLFWCRRTTKRTASGSFPMLMTSMADSEESGETDGRRSVTAPENIVARFGPCGARGRHASMGGEGRVPWVEALYRRERAAGRLPSPDHDEAPREIGRPEASSRRSSRPRAGREGCGADPRRLPAPSAGRRSRTPRPTLCLNQIDGQGQAPRPLPRIGGRATRTYGGRCSFEPLSLAQSGKSATTPLSGSGGKACRRPR
jgi:hypothetical protein